MAKKKASAKAAPAPVTPAPKARAAVKPKAAAKKPTAKAVEPPKVRVRMYRQGLGDCFLIRFPRAKPGTGDFTILIDCGVILGTPGADALMGAVVADLAETTNKHIDILVATHEHWDHVSGFFDDPKQPERHLFKDFAINKVWLSWTEDPRDATAQKLRADRSQKLQALQIGLAGLRERLRGMLPAATAGRPDDPVRAELLRAHAEVQRASEVLSFFGIDPEEPPADPGGLGAAEAGVSRTGAAMEWVRKVTKDPSFFRPGDLVELPEAGGVRVYVLGPPTNLKQLLKDMPTASGRETYDGLQAAAKAEIAFFAGGAAELEPSFNPSIPFDQKYRIRPKDAESTDFFRDHYFGTGGDDAEAWRRIEGDWSGDASRFALQLDSDTNNTSLALAFELPDGRVLLFPGDAQVGNWESWHTDPDGVKRLWKLDGSRSVGAEQLLNRTVLYKVGHHGSHNATLRAQGLEMMTDPNLAAMVPVDVFVAHDKKRWTQMPFNPLLSRLDELAKGRVLQADRAFTAPAAGGPTPWPANPTDFAATVCDATKTIDVVIDAAGKTEKRPLYVDYEL